MQQYTSFLAKKRLGEDDDAPQLGTQAAAPAAPKPAIPPAPVPAPPKPPVASAPVAAAAPAGVAPVSMAAPVSLPAAANPAIARPTPTQAPVSMAAPSPAPAAAAPPASAPIPPAPVPPPPAAPAAPAPINWASPTASKDFLQQAGGDMRKAFDLFKSQRNSVDAQPDFQNAWAFLNQNGGGSLGFDPGADLQNDPRARAVRALLGQGNATDADLKFFADAGHAPSYLTPGTYKTQNPFDMDPSDPTVQASRDTLNMLASGSTAGGAGGAQAGRSAYTGSPSAAPATQPGAAPPGTFEMGDARPFTPRPLGGGTMAGPSSGIPPAPVPAPPRGAAVGGGNNVGTITGNEVPYSVNPTRSADLQGLLGGLTGEAQRQLANPSVYDDELFKSAQRLAEQGLDESYGTAQRRLEGNLAKRGLNWSSVAAGDLSDLEVSRQRAGDEMRTGLLRDRAASIGSARSAAFNNARGVFGDTAGLEANERGEMRGERGYTDDLRTQARNEAIQELLMDEQFQGSANSEWQQYLQQALGFGFQSPGGGAASNAYANAANQYGAQAGSDPWLQYLMSLSAS